MLPRRSEQDHRSGVASLSSLGPSPGFASIAGIPVPFPGPSDADRLLARAKDRPGWQRRTGSPWEQRRLRGGRVLPRLRSPLPPVPTAEPPSLAPGYSTAPWAVPQIQQSPCRGLPLRPPAPRAGSARASCPAAEGTSLKLPLTGKRCRRELGVVAAGAGGVRTKGFFQLLPEPGDDAPCGVSTLNPGLPHALSTAGCRKGISCQREPQSRNPKSGTHSWLGAKRAPGRGRERG